MTPRPGSPARDVRTLLKVLWRWKVLFGVLLVAPPVAAYLIVRDDPKEYRSGALVALTSAPTIVGNAPQQNIQAVARVMRTTRFQQLAARLRKPPGPLGGVSAVADADTGFITITSTGTSPTAAAANANAYADAVTVRQRDVAQARIASQINVVEAELEALERNDPLAVQLRHQLVELRSATTAPGTGASILQAAEPSSTAIGPYIRRDVEIALVIGLLLAIGAVRLAENSNRRLRDLDDLETVTGMSALSSIPESAFSVRGPVAGPAEEAFQMLRGALAYFNPQRPVSSVAIVSASAEEGKTTVAVGLALAAAKAGRDVILLDGDLRLPRVGERLGLDPALPGLGAVLAGQRSPADVLIAVPMHAENAGALRVLPAGPPPPNPAALASSDKLRALIGELESQAELVVVDTPAALAVSDALALVQYVSGAVVVVRLNRTDQSSVHRLQMMIEAGHGSILGAVATGADARQAFGLPRQQDPAHDEARPLQRRPPLPGAEVR